MNDLISRQAAIEALAGWKISPIVLDPVPAADVRENVRGEWKKRKDKPLQNWYQCSNCGAICGETPKYCSECGADMRGDKP